MWRISPKASHGFCPHGLNAAPSRQPQPQTAAGFSCSVQWEKSVTCALITISHFISRDKLPCLAHVTNSEGVKTVLSV